MKQKKSFYSLLSLRGMTFSQGNARQHSKMMSPSEGEGKEGAYPDNRLGQKFHFLSLSLSLSPS